MQDFRRTDRRMGAMLSAFDNLTDLAPYWPQPARSRSSVHRSVSPDADNLQRSPARHGLHARAKPRRNWAIGHLNGDETAIPRGFPNGPTPGPQAFSFIKLRRMKFASRVARGRESSTPDFVLLAQSGHRASGQREGRREAVSRMSRQQEIVRPNYAFSFARSNS